MNDEEILISGIEYKVKKLTDNLRRIKEDMMSAESENKELKKKVNNQNVIINELENKLKTIKLAKSLASEKESEDAKARINELVREIDRCIGYLNV